MTHFYGSRTQRSTQILVSVLRLAHYELGEGRAIAQAVIRRLITAEVRFAHTWDLRWSK
jgi:hypothetical protein